MEDELEDLTERLKETLEVAEEKREEKAKWTMHTALSTAVIAVLAAIAGLLGNHHANEAILEEIKASNQWSYYQSKSIKSELAASTAQTLAALGKPLSPADMDKAARYEKEKEQIKETADEAEKNSEKHLKEHVIISRAVTLFQIAIAISAIAILTMRREMWYISLLLTAAGCVFLVMGVLS